MNHNKIRIVYFRLDEISRYANNPRKNEKAVDAVAASIQAFGFLVPIVIDANREIVAGDTRYQAAAKLQLEKVPCVFADDLSEDQVRAYRLADNKTAELAVWDQPLLDEELADIGDTMDMSQFGFDLGISDIYQADSSRELDLDEYGDDEFDYQCPECGFRFNEYQ